MQRAFTAKFLCAAAFTCLVTVAQSHAAAIVTNLSDLPANTGTIYASGPPQYYAQEFTTGATAATLSDVIAVLGNASGTFIASASLEANVSGLPSNVALTTFSVPSISAGAPTDETFTPALNITLSANTNYWFVLAATGTTGSYQWDYTNTTQANLPNYALTNDGVTWSVGTPPGPYMLEVDGATITPEPSSLLLISVGGLLGVLFALRRRSATTTL